MSRAIDYMWAYIAGFLDGDGCIYCWINSANTRFPDSASYTNKKIARVRFTQTSGAFLVLYKIQEFFTAQGIVSNIFRKKPPRNVKCHNAMDLEIGSMDSIEKILENVLPYLIVKKRKAFETLELIREAKSLKDKYGQYYRKYLTRA